MSWFQFSVGVRETGYVAIACWCGVWDQFPTKRAPDPGFPDQFMDGVDLKWLTDWADDHRKRYSHAERAGAVP